ncbi:uncharacterized protein LOC128993627 [Macrosteles quadrilineatus]|uniref:uncharacterized protein LOC128993627 n=1 Tax=Macrosteles quadrilineatus TaxID=74068 RepID=UPI0023E2F5A1|nr:uncharacterized protein LOC128993627 [Macrosteles quadrilineatus]
MVVSNGDTMAHGIKEEWEEGTVPLTTEKHAKIDEKKGKSDGKGMSSRRIFSPQFKLLVLNSYRTDSDCKGNQRATARKYGIHRRQIQKWLQMESNLRLTVQATSENRANKSEDEVALNLSSPRQRGVVDDESCAAGCLETPVSVGQPSPATRPSSASTSDTEEINVDGDSSSEDEVSSTDSYDRSDSDRALDLTCAALSKRRFYSTDFKLQVLDAFYYDKICHGNQRAVARKFGIHRRQVQKWLKLENSLRSEASEDCLDLSCKKRKAEEEVCEVRAKRFSPGCCTALCCDDRVEVTSTCQESALCLVKPRTPQEVSSTMDLYAYQTSPPVCYLSPTELPTYDPHYLPCWSTPFYPSYPIDNVPKWFSHDYSDSSIKVYGMYR